MSKDQDLLAVAYHETGHAVASYILGKQFRFVTTRPRGGSAGYVAGGRYIPCRNKVHPAGSCISSECPGCVRKAVREIMICYAGPALEYLHLHSRDDRDSLNGEINGAIRAAEHDILDAKGVIEHLGITGDEYVDVLWVRCYDHMFALFLDEQVTTWVNNLAVSLIENRSMRYFKAKAALGDQRSVSDGIRRLRKALRPAIEDVVDLAMDKDKLKQALEEDRKAFAQWQALTRAQQAAKGRA